MSKKPQSSLNGVFPEDDNVGDYLFKMVLVGDSGVGKTNILSRFARDIFSEDTKTTIGVEFATKKVTVDKKVARVQIWDTAGQERYRAITNSYYRGAHAAIIVYDITNSISFNNVTKWLAEIRNNSDPSILIMLVANKSDLASMRSVHESDARQLVEREHLMTLIETSAKAGDRISDVFNSITKALVEAEENNSFGMAIPKITSQPLGKSVQPKKQSGCCKDTK
ncbi:Ras-related protein RABA1e [Tritrichomonas foetus]|uniref:Ras-related protein RABA1e n=1 Tax=Tritrichomonas foetus TaxID=1144522 RepID=A0A1J4KG86_9EUKA|nr:Ras-related protein RABA1e [Tritrichomonas foetus]|eukprot:OHT08373.1 Ras-related protein RABA1e [Tritrichomonas foetus]